MATNKVISSQPSTHRYLSIELLRHVLESLSFVRATLPSGPIKNILSLLTHSSLHFHLKETVSVQQVSLPSSDLYKDKNYLQ